MCLFSMGLEALCRGESRVSWDLRCWLVMSQVFRLEEQVSRSEKKTLDFGAFLVEAFGIKQFSLSEAVLIRS